jgi:hypothetical protein
MDRIGRAKGTATLAEPRCGVNLPAPAQWNVVSVLPHPNTEKDWRRVVLEANGNREEAVCFAGSAADELVPGPLPLRWRVKQNDRGLILEMPRQSGRGFSGGGYRNSEAAFHLEQDRLDRRLAAQLAARAGGFDRETAEAILRWLKGPP